MFKTTQSGNIGIPEADSSRAPQKTYGASLSWNRRQGEAASTCRWELEVNACVRNICASCISAKNRRKESQRLRATVIMLAVFWVIKVSKWGWVLFLTYHFFLFGGGAGEGFPQKVSHPKQHGHSASQNVALKCLCVSM